MCEISASGLCMSLSGILLTPLARSKQFGELRTVRVLPFKKNIGTLCLFCNFRKPHAIGHFHNGVILLQLPEFISFSLSNSNFVIPGESKEQ